MSSIDPRSQKNIETLLPKVQPVFTKLLAALQEHFAEAGVIPKYISGNRTWKEQDEIYAQGRTKPGPIRTKAKGGESNHNFGLAIDIGLFKDGDYLEKSPFYKQIGQVVSKFSELEWGGNWKSIVDEPHVQYKTGLTLAEMRKRVLEKKAIV
jgi:peptidoglycan L-alanyl-D-glutamate endopeptidase CwlK